MPSRISMFGNGSGLSSACPSGFESMSHPNSPPAESGYANLVHSGSQQDTTGASPIRPPVTHRAAFFRGRSVSGERAAGCGGRSESGVVRDGRGVKVESGVGALGGGRVLCCSLSGGGERLTDQGRALSREGEREVVLS